MRYAEAKRFASQVRRNYNGKGHLVTRIAPRGYLRRTKGFVGAKGWKVQGAISVIGRPPESAWFNITE